MSSVSSHDGSDRDATLYRLADGLRYTPRLKNDFLNTDSIDSRDTDSWSVAATVDDQESVISNHGTLTPSVISSSHLTVDDDRSTFGDTSDISAAPGIVSNRSSHSSNNSIPDDLSSRRESVGRLETLRDLNGSQCSINEDDDDKRSRSNAAEFGDDGARSAADFETSEMSDDDDDSHRPPSMNDDISAPPQPQPSFASNTKSYAELLEENDILQNQLRDLQITQKHQQDLIDSLRTITQCGDVYVEDDPAKSMHLSSVDHSSSIDGDLHLTPSNGDYEIDHAQALPIVNATLLIKRLATLASDVESFVMHSVTELEKRIQVEQCIFQHICESYLTSLPFGTDNQQLLNTAYKDQLRRFQSTLGSNFAKWYRRQTVQSLTLNQATKEYWHDMGTKMTGQLTELLGEHAAYDMERWAAILHLCADLSLEIHGGDADVTVEPITPGAKYDLEIMTAVEPATSNQERFVKSMVRPLFIDEEEKVLLRARVTLTE